MILSQDINGVMDLLEDVARQGRENGHSLLQIFCGI